MCINYDGNTFNEYIPPCIPWHFSPSQRSVLPIVFLVTMVPVALRSLTRSSRVVLGWFLTVLMIIETPRGENRGREIDSYFVFLPLLSPSYQAAWRWSCSPFQPCVGLQSCPWHPWTALWSWPWWWVWTLDLYTGNKLRLGALPLRECS